MAVTAITSHYNVRRRKQSATGPEDAPRMSKRAKLERQDVFTPPASPEATDLLPTVQGCYDDDYEDSVLIGIVEWMQRHGASAMCSREISEALLQEGKVQLSGTTPSTVVDAAIKQHHKRCSSNGRPNVILKVADPRYPRKTLYHLANVDPFAPQPPVFGGPSTTALDQKHVSQDRDSEASASDEEFDWRETLSNDGQGPFAASLDTRRRMSFASSSELDFSLSIDDAKRSVATPGPSAPASPAREPVSKDSTRQQLNIAQPPSPFMTPQASDDDDDVPEPRLSAIPHGFAKARHPMEEDDDDSYDTDVQSPEAVSLDDLDYLLDF